MLAWSKHAQGAIWQIRSEAWPTLDVHGTGFFLLSALYSEHSMSPLACLLSSKTLQNQRSTLARTQATKCKMATAPHSSRQTCISPAAPRWPPLCGSRPAGPSRWPPDCAGRCAASATPRPPGLSCVGQKQQGSQLPLLHPLLKNKAALLENLKGQSRDARN